MHAGIDLARHGLTELMAFGRAAARGSTLARRRRDVASIEKTLEPALEPAGL